MAHREALAFIVAVERTASHIPSNDNIAVGGHLHRRRRHLRTPIDAIEPPQIARAAGTRKPGAFHYKVLLRSIDKVVTLLPVERQGYIIASGGVHGERVGVIVIAYIALADAGCITCHPVACMKDVAMVVVAFDEAHVVKAGDEGRCRGCQPESDFTLDTAVGIAHQFCRYRHFEVIETTSILSFVRCSHGDVGYLLAVDAYVAAPPFVGSRQT